MYNRKWRALFQSNKSRTVKLWAQSKLGVCTSKTMICSIFLYFSIHKTSSRWCHRLSRARAEKIVEVGATSEATKKSEADLSCCTRPPASDEAQQITTKKKHSRGNELRGKISKQEESGGVRDWRETRKRGNAGCGGGGRKGDDVGSEEGGRGEFLFGLSATCSAMLLREGPADQAKGVCVSAPRLCLLRRAMIRTFAVMTPLFYWITVDL